MAFYYCKNTSTVSTPSDDGRFTSRQTGAFTNTTCYASLATILDGSDTTTDIAAGDTICVSDSHSESASTVNLTGIAAAAGVIIECVEDANRENIQTASSTQISSTLGNINLNTNESNWFLYGMRLSAGSQLSMNGSNQRLLARNCTLISSGSGDVALAITGTDGCHARLENCTFNFGNNNSLALYLTGGAICEIIGGTTAGNAATAFTHNNTGGNAGFMLTMEGFDFTNMSSTATLFNGFGGATTDDCFVVRCRNCRIGSSQTLIDETISPVGSMRVFEFVGVDDTDAYRYHYQDGLGTVISTTSTYVTSDTDIEGSTNYAYQIVTVSACSKVHPFRWRLPIGYADLSAASTDNIRVRLTCANSLTQEEVAVFAGTSDATTNTIMNINSTIESVAESSTWIPDHTATGGTALATDSSQWTNGATNEYAIVLDLSAVNVDATSPLAPSVWIEIYKSETLYVSSQLVFEA